MSPFSKFVVYADESGDHSLVKVDPDYPVFALSLCLFRKDVYMRHVVPLFQALKFDYFGHDAVILHEREIRKQARPFDILVDQDVRRRFLSSLGAALAKSRFKIAAAVIDKRKLRDDLFPNNPYVLALQFCLEKTYQYLLAQGQSDTTTHFIFEQRGKREDTDLELEFLRITKGANSLRQPMRHFEIRFVDKKANSSGMQIADLTARPIGLRVLRPHQPNQAFDVIRPKICRMRGDQAGWNGLRVFP
jgi:hypothetical protein